MHCSFLPYRVATRWTTYIILSIFLNKLKPSLVKIVNASSVVALRPVGAHRESRGPCDRVLERLRLPL